MNEIPTLAPCSIQNKTQNMHPLKVIHSCQPAYLHNLLKPLNRTRNLRSSYDDQLVVPRVTSRMGERAFLVAAPQLWNCIPLQIKKSKSAQSFRKKLKTLYFGQGFPS